MARAVSYRGCFLSPKGLLLGGRGSFWSYKVLLGEVGFLKEIVIWVR